MITIPQFRGMLSPPFNIDRDTNPLVMLRAKEGVQTTGGGSAGYLDTVAKWVNIYGSAGDYTQTTSGSQPLYLAHTGENYLHQSGVAGNYCSIPNETAFNITGNIDLRIEATLASWTSPSANTSLISKRDGVNDAWQLELNTSGILLMNLWHTGGFAQAICTTTTGFSNKTRHWVRAALTASTGAVKFYTSNDGVSWTQLGSTVTLGALTLVTNTGAITAGAQAVGYAYFGASHRLQVYASDNGTNNVLDVNFSTFSHRASSGTATTGQTVTIHLALADNTTVVVGRPMIRFDGVDDSLNCAGWTMVGNRTYTYLAYFTTKINMLTYSSADSANHTCVMSQGNSGSTDAPTTTFRDYRQNGVSIGTIQRSQLYTDLAGKRSLVLSRCTEPSGGAGVNFAGYPSGGFLWQGDVEELYVHNTLLSDYDVHRLEQLIINEADVI